MSELLARLWELQQLDTGLRQRSEWIANLDDGSKARAKLAEAQAALDKARESLGQLEATYRRKEMDLQSTDAERQEKAKKAYGGTVADAKELSALEKKIAELKRRSSTLEDELLALMDQIEAAREDVAKREALVTKLGNLAQQLATEYATDRARFEAEMESLRQQREAVVSQVEPAALREYEAMRAKLDGVAVAAVDGDLCTSCRNVVPPAMINRVKDGRELVKCQNCRRILYMGP